MTWYYRDSQRRPDSSGKRKGKPSLEYNWPEIDRVIRTLLIKFAKQGFRPTLRELHYALVSLNVFPNLKKSYGSLSDHMTQKREEGHFPMDCIVDERHPIVDIDDVYYSPGAWIRNYIDKLRYLSESYHENNKGFPKWGGQDNYVELWTEKQAMVKHLNHIAIKENLQVRIVSFGGFPGTTELNEHVEERLKEKMDEGRNVYILWFGDFDPSGESIDKTTFERLNRNKQWSLYAHSAKSGVEFELIRVAVTKEQIHDYGLPWNIDRLNEQEQKKLQDDPRYRNFQRQHGRYACEVDSLPVINLEAFSTIVTEHVYEYFNINKYQELLDEHKKAFTHEYIDNNLVDYVRSFAQELNIKLMWRWLESIS